MHGIKTFENWKALNPAKREFAIGFFTGAVGMHLEGFTFRHEKHDHAAYALVELDEAIRAAVNDEKTNQPIPLVPARITELCERLTSVGGIKEKCGGSELVEIADFILELPPLQTWTKELPKEMGAYWWWSGDEDTLPIHIEIMSSGHGENSTYFAPMNQWGWTQPRAVNDMGGWWMPLETPKPPQA